MCWEHSPWLAVVSFPILFTFYISFSKGRLKRNIMPPKKLEKTRAFRQGQAETSWQICTSSEADQMHFLEASHKDNLPSWRCGQAPLIRGDPGRSCSKSVQSGGCRNSRPTALKESLSEPWTAQMFQGLLPRCFLQVSFWVVQVPDLCTPALRPSLLVFR